MAIKRLVGAPVIAATVAAAVVLAGMGASNGQVASGDLAATSQLAAVADQGGVKPGADTVVAGKPVQSVEAWHPDPQKLGGLPKDLFVVNEVPVIPAMPPEQLTKEQLADARDAWRSQGPAFGVDVKQVDPGRVSGEANMLVSIPRTAKPGVGGKRVEVKLQVPANTKIANITAPGWSCRRDICRHKSVLGSTDTPQPLQVKLAIGEQSQPGKVQLRAQARWQEQTLRNAVGGSTGIPGSFEVIGWEPKGTSNVGDLEIDPALGLEIGPAPVNRVAILTNGTPEERQSTLQAKITNAANRPITVNWKQIDGPAVKLLNPADQQSSGETFGQQIEFPANLTSVTRVKFAVTAASQGVTLRKTITVIATPSEMNTHPARMGTLRKLFKRTGDTGDAAYTSVRDTQPARDSARAEARAQQVATIPVVIDKKPSNVPGMRPASQGGARSPFCQIADKIAKSNQAKVTLSDGSQLTVPASANYTGDCAAGTGSIAFTTATLVVGNLAFSDVTGTMTGQGFTITDAKLATPSQFVGAPYVGSVSQIAVEPLTGSQVGATLTDGVWSAVSGSFFLKPFTVGGNTVHGFGFQKLPNGWSVPAQAAQLAFAGPGQVAFVQTATSTEGASVRYSIANLASATSTLSIDVTASDFGFRLLTNENLVLNGTGVIEARPGLPVSGSVTMTATCPTTCVLIQKLTVSSVTLKINPSSAISMSAAFTAKMEQNHDFSWTGTGTYVASGVYNLGITSAAGAASIGGVGQFTDTGGSIVSKPAALGSATELTVSVTGKVTGLSGGDALANLKTTGLFSNTCPETALNCGPNSLRFFIGLEADFSFQKSSAEHINIVSEWDMADGDFSKEVQMNNTTLGPEILGINTSKLILSNNPADSDQSCAPTGLNGQILPAKPVVPGQIYLSLTGQGQFDGDKSYEYGAVFAPGGYCLHGSIGDYEVGTGQTLHGGTLVFSTFDGYFTPPGGDNINTPQIETYQPKRIEKLTLYIMGTFKLPVSITDLFGGDALGDEVQAVVSVSYDPVKGISLRLQVDYTLGSPMYLVGNANTQSLRFDGISLFIIVTRKSEGEGEDKVVTKTVTIGFSVRGSFYVPGGSNPASEPASVTPLVGTISVSQPPVGSPSITLQLGVSTSSGPVRNGFGVKDLTIYNLALAGTLSATERSVSFLGDASLPSEWTSKLVLVNEPRVRIGFNINFANPAASCVVFSIGQAGQAENAFDLGGFGVLTAKYLNFVLAPKGCSLPTGDGFLVVSPGIAVSFDGAVFGVAVKAHFAVTVDAVTNKVKSIETELQVPALEFGDVKISGALPTSGPLPDPLPPVYLHFWYSTGSPYGIKAVIDGSVLLGDPGGWGSAQVNVKGKFEMSSVLPGPLEAKSPKQFSLEFAGMANVRLLGMDLSRFDLIAKVSGVVGTPAIPLIVDSASVKAKFNLAVFGTPMSMSGTVALVFKDGTFERVYLSIGMTIDLYFASVSGSVIVSYCRGERVPNTNFYDDPTWDPVTFTETAPCKPGLRYGANEAGHVAGQCRANAGIYFGVYLKGEARFLWWSTSVTLPVYTSSSAADGCTDTEPLAPGMPSAPTAVAGNSKVTLTGNGAMPQAGGGAIKEYSMAAYEVHEEDGATSAVPAGSCSYTVASSSSCEISGLQNGTVYFFTTKAKNDQGEAGPSTESNLVTPAAPPGSTDPRAPSASAGTSSVTVTPQAPEVAPSSPIVSYLVRALDGTGTAITGAECTVVVASGSSCVVGTGSSAGKLTNGVPYTFQTKATLADDSTMDWSPSSSPATPRAPVVVPNTPTVAAGDRQVVVTPTSSGTPSGYIASAFSQDSTTSEWTVPEGSCQITDPSLNPTCTITGLDNNVPVKVSVRGSYPGEQSNPSTLSAAVTPVLPNGVPGQPSVVSGNASATVTFSPATSGSPTTYTAKAYSQDPSDLAKWTVAGGTNCSVAAGTDPLRCTITGLDNSKFYKVVATTNVSVTGSELSETFRPQPAPVATGVPQVIAQDRRLDVTVVPATTGGIPIYYLVEAFDSRGDLQAACTVHDATTDPPGCVISGVTNNVEYRVRVTAVNGAGSAVSAFSAPVEPGAMPAQPQPPVITVKDGAATVTFRPGTNGGTPKSYTGTARASDGSVGGTCTATVVGSAAACTITGLTNDQPYRFTATASNSVGTSSASVQTEPLRTGRPVALPPTVVMRSGTSPSAVVTGRAAGNGGTPSQTIITAYVQNTQQPAGQCTVAGAAGSCNINNLKKGTKYEFRSVAINDAGTSLASAPAGPYQG